jgi:hypothetical protein
MQSKRATLWVCVALVALFAGCGGGGEPAAPAEEPAEQPAATGTPDPPPQEEIEIGGGGMSVGGNILSIDNDLTLFQLPPTMFGAIADFQWEVNGANPVSVDSVTITAGDNTSLTLTISKTSFGNVQYSANDGTRDLTVTAYTPVNGNCAVYSDAMGNFVSSGTTFQAGSHSGPLGDGVTINFKVTPAGDTGCN